MKHIVLLRVSISDAFLTLKWSSDCRGYLGQRVRVADQDQPGQSDHLESLVLGEQGKLTKHFLLQCICAFLVEVLFYFYRGPTGEIGEPGQNGAVGPAGTRGKRGPRVTK